MSMPVRIMREPPAGSPIDSPMLPWGAEGPPPADRLPATRPEDYHPLAAWPPRPYGDWERRRHAACSAAPNDAANRLFLLLHPEVAHELLVRACTGQGEMSDIHAFRRGWAVPLDGSFDDTLPPGFAGCRLRVRDGVVVFTPEPTLGHDYTDLIPPPDVDMPGLVWAGHAASRPAPHQPDTPRPAVPPPAARPPAGPWSGATPAAPPPVCSARPRPGPEPDCPAAPPARGRTKRFDWARGAMLLGQGHSVTAVALELGCSRQSLWRALKIAPQLRALVEEERMKRAADFAARLDGARGAVLESLILAACHDRNPTVLVHLSRMMRLGEGADYTRLARGLDAVRRPHRPGTGAAPPDALRRDAARPAANPPGDPPADPPVGWPAVPPLAAGMAPWASPGGRRTGRPQAGGPLPLRAPLPVTLGPAPQRPAPQAPRIAAGVRMPAAKATAGTPAAAASSLSP
ncbi:hypothetical protein [Oleisolibacter albus]|uniref:hypothetical protein n=1 Tax=Oleisolibacter albus TaxID=2171757 RepID=UPI0012D791B4|nr:hypothetical protein [Oleisolibacter albus]